MEVPPPARELPAWKWLTLALVATLGTIAYALSFRRLVGIEISAFATAVGISAAVSWVGFGVLLAVISRGKAALVDWIDLCLRTMAVGIAVLVLAMLVNVVSKTGLFDLRTPWAVHLGILSLSDISMATYFARGARGHGVSVMAALFLWFVGLNGLFALAMIVIRAL